MLIVFELPSLHAYLWKYVALDKCTYKVPLDVFFINRSLAWIAVSLSDVFPQDPCCQLPHLGFFLPLLPSLAKLGGRVTVKTLKIHYGHSIHF